MPWQILAWWLKNKNHLPLWSEAAKIVFAFSPNSASCERVFALLKAMFGDEQMRALADYIQSALMLTYNNRIRSDSQCVGEVQRRRGIAHAWGRHARGNISVPEFQ